MNYKKKIQEIEFEINMINKYYIKRVIKIAEKTENSAQLKYLFKVIEIELS